MLLHVYYAIHTSHLTGIAGNVCLDVVTAPSRGVLLKVARKYSLPWHHWSCLYELNSTYYSTACWVKCYSNCTFVIN